MAYRNSYNFHRISFKHICKQNETLRNFNLCHYSKIAAVLEIFYFEICLLLLLATVYHYFTSLLFTEAATLLLFEVLPLRQLKVLNFRT